MKYISHQLIFTSIFSIFFAISLTAQCVADTEISTENNGRNEILTCPGDGRNDLIIFQSNAQSANYAYIITNENDVILDYRQNPYINFEQAAFSPFRVYGISYSDDLTIRRGRKLFSTQLATGCFELSKNFITVRKSIPVAGRIATIQGNESLFFCPGEPTNIVYLERFDSESSSYAYALTDANGKILAVTSGAAFELSEYSAASYKIYGIAYRGSLLDIVGDNIEEDYLADACFDVSENAVTVNIEALQGGTITANVEAAIIDVCDLEEPLKFSVTNVTNSYAYLVVDEAGIVQAIISEDGEFDANVLGAGNYRVTGLAYTRNLTIQVGDNINSGGFSKGCAQLSENILQLQKTALSTGLIATENGLTDITRCEDTIFSVNFIATENAEVVYVVTDENDKVLSLSSTSDVEVSTTNTNARIYGIAYGGQLSLQVGDVLGEATISEDCYERSENFIAVRTADVAGGTLRLMSGGTNFYACPEATGQLILQAQQQNGSGDLYTYLLLDKEDIVRAISTDGSFRFTEALTGQFTILGVAHLLPLSISLGDAFSIDYNLSTECYDLSDNRVEVVWQEPSGGRISTLTGDREVFLCEDAQNTRIDLKYEDASGGNYIYILTDAQGTILSYSIRGFDVESIESGDLLVYGLSFTGNYREEVGVNIEDAVLSNSCHALTESPLPIKRFAPQETLVATEALEAAVDICVGSNEEVKINVINTGNQNAYLYILTDVQDRVVSIFEEGEITLGDNANGERKIWGVSATGEVSIKKGEVITETPITNGCYQLSINYVEVKATQLSNTKISSFQNQDNIAICYGDGASDYIGFYTLETTTANYNYVITDANNVVLKVMRGNIQNFETPGPSVTRIWGINYTGRLSLRPGQVITTASLSDDCYALSENFVEISRVQLDAGIISIVNGSDELKLCAAVGASQTYNLATTSQSNARYSYLITDEADVVLGITENSTVDFGNFNQDQLKVYGIAHINDLSIKIGENVNVATLTTGCYDLAANQLEVLRDVVDAGTVQTPTGETDVFFCAEDSQADMVVFTSTSVSRQDYQFVVTDEDNTVLALPNGSLFDFGNLGDGDYRVWGVSYTGDLNLAVGDLLESNAALSNGCYSLSKTYMSVAQVTPYAEQITTSDGQTSQITYVGDNDPDLIEFTLPNGAGGLLLVITNTTGKIVALSTSGSFDFNPLTVGFYRTYGVAYTGNVKVKVGDNFTGTNVTDGCFDVADNFVQIICAPGSRRNGAYADTGNNGITILPNPVATDFTLGFQQQSNAKVSTIRIYDVAGKQVYHQETESFVGDNQLNINVSKWQAGFYLLQIENEIEVKTMSFVKQD